MQKYQVKFADRQNLHSKKKLKLPDSLNNRILGLCKGSEETSLENQTVGL